MKDDNNFLICPACGHDQWRSGPEGGMAQNIECAQCRAQWNYAPWFALEPINDIAEQSKVQQ